MINDPVGRLCSQVIKKIYEITYVELARLNLSPELYILDIGCGEGEATAKYGKIVGSEKIFGIDIFDSVLIQAQSRGIKGFKVDLERDNFPFEDNFFDLVICNQVFEHLKQIYRPISEIHRCLKPKGVLVFSAPNLASLHNRILLLFGRQPTSIRIFGPHVRGFTFTALKDFLTYSELFEIMKVIGIGFYPFPMNVGGFLLGKIFISMSHTLMFILRKTNKEGKVDWSQKVIDMKLQTNYS